MVSDPVQKALGLHHRRLTALVDGLERAFTAGDARGFVAYDLYVARLMDLSDLLLGLTRTPPHRLTARQGDRSKTSRRVACLNQMRRGGIL